MIQLKPAKITLSQDQQVKQKAAVKQMTDLMASVQQWVKYRFLQPNDRVNFHKQGYARDLVDNLVYITLRPATDVSDSSQDKLVTGFTQAAFDPSLYACDNIRTGLTEASDGKCFWCESLIDQNDALISHFRPPAGYQDSNEVVRNSYYNLAYQPDNLVYCCHDCGGRHKALQFPVVGAARMPDASQDEECTVLINPTREDPRQFIRFNPINAQAYPYDEVKAFYQDTQDLNGEQIDALIFNNPKRIPNQKDIDGQLVTEAATETAYLNWKAKCAAKNGEYKGQRNIEILGLNRPTLVRARANHLIGLRGLYLAGKCGDDNTNNGISALSQADSDTTDTSEKTPTAVMIVQYLSLTTDAIATWNAENTLLPTGNSGAQQ